MHFACGIVQLQLLDFTSHATGPAHATILHNNNVCSCLTSYDVSLASTARIWHNSLESFQEYKINTLQKINNYEKYYCKHCLDDISHYTVYETEPVLVLAVEVV